MIPKDLLQQLGWSPELIDEVTRVADGINSSGALPASSAPSLDSAVHASTSNAVYSNVPHAVAKAPLRGRAT